MSPLLVTCHLHCILRRIVFDKPYECSFRLFQNKKSAVLLLRPSSVGAEIFFNLSRKKISGKTMSLLSNILLVGLLSLGQSTIVQPEQIAKTVFLNDTIFGKLFHWIITNIINFQLPTTHPQQNVE